jgi:hypothetical protein
MTFEFKNKLKTIGDVPVNDWITWGFIFVATWFIFIAATANRSYRTKSLKKEQSNNLRLFLVALIFICAYFYLRLFLFALCLFTNGVTKVQDNYTKACRGTQCQSQSKRQGWVFHGTVKRPSSYE